MKKFIFSLLLRLSGFILGITGIVSQIVSGSEFMGADMLIYFTIQTNIFTTVIFGGLFFKSIYLSIKKKTPVIAKLTPSYHLGFTYYITITFAVFWTMVSGMDIGTDTNVLMLVGNYLLHLVVPLLAILDCLLFMEHGKVKKNVAFKWLGYPLIYLFSVIIRAQLGGPLYTLNGIEMMYPYPFLEPAVVGVGGMIGIIIAMTIGFYLFGRLYIYIDDKIAQRLSKIKLKHTEN